VAFEMETVDSTILTAPPELLDISVLVRVVKSLRQRLLVRNEVTDELRSAYLRDVVAVREILEKKRGWIDLGDPLGERLWEEDDGYDPRLAALPSLDLRPALRLDLYAPRDCVLGPSEPCEYCGGALAVVCRETDRVSVLEEQVRDVTERARRAGADACSAELASLRDRMEAGDVRSRYDEERTVWDETTRDMRERMDGFDWEGYADMQRAVVLMSASTEKMEREAIGYRETETKYYSALQTIEEKTHAIENRDETIVDLERVASTREEDVRSLKSDLEKVKGRESVLKEEKAGVEDNLAETNLEMETERSGRLEAQAQFKKSEEEIKDLNEKMADTKEFHVAELKECATKEKELQASLKSLKYSVSKQEMVVENYRKQIDQTQKKLRKYQQDEEDGMFKDEIEKNLATAQQAVADEAKRENCVGKTEPRKSRRRSTLHGDASIADGPVRVRDLWDMADVATQQLVIAAAAVCETIVFQEGSIGDNREGQAKFEAPQPSNTSVKTANFARKMDEGREVELADLIKLFENKNDRDYFLSYLDYRHRAGQRFLRDHLEWLRNSKENPRFEAEATAARMELAEAKEKEYRIQIDHKQVTEEAKAEKKRLDCEMEKMKEILRDTTRKLEKEREAYETISQEYAVIKPDADEAIALRSTNKDLLKSLDEAQGRIEGLREDKLFLEKEGRKLRKELYQLNERFDDCSRELNDTTMSLHAETDRADDAEERFGTTKAELTALREGEARRLQTNVATGTQFSPHTAEGAAQVDLLDPKNYMVSGTPGFLSAAGATGIGRGESRAGTSGMLAGNVELFPTIVDLGPAGSPLLPPLSNVTGVDPQRAGTGPRPRASNRLFSLLGGARRRTAPVGKGPGRSAALRARESILARIPSIK